MNPGVQILKGQPLPAEISRALRSAPQSTHVQILELVSVLLKHTVPELYGFLPPETRADVAHCFRSCIGLGNLVAKIEMVARSKADVSLDLTSLLNVHLELLGDVFRYRLMEGLQREPSLPKDIERLLFKGKVYSVVRELDMRFNGLRIPPVFSSMDAYVGFLSRELLNSGSGQENLSTSHLPHYLLALVALSGKQASAFFDVFLQPEHFGFLVTVSAHMKRFERKTVLLKLLEHLSLRYLQESLDLDLLSASFTIAKTLDNSIWTDLMVEVIITRYNYGLNIVCAMLMTELGEKLFEDLTAKILAVWGSAHIIAEEPIHRQQCRTHLLLCMCMQMEQLQLQAMTTHPTFMLAISNRLSSYSNRVKAFGIFFADSVCAMAGLDRIFDIVTEEPLGIPDARLCRKDVVMSLEDAWEILSAPVIHTNDDTPSSLWLQIENLRLKEAEEEDIEDLDDPSIARPEKIPAPIYIKDILTYLSADTKKPLACEKIELGLKSAPTLLRQKLAFGSEVAFYAEDLVNILAGLGNFFDQKDFESWKLNALIAVAVSAPQVTRHLCRLILTGDYSLQQRMCLLLSISLAARELRGYQDDDVRLSFAAKPFASQMLPENLHRKYLASDPSADGAHGAFGYAQLENSIQNELMEDLLKSAQDQLGPGRVVRMLAGLKKRKPAENTPSLAFFNKNVALLFYFPLVSIWHESGGFNIGHYTPVLTAHYLRTLSLILHAAYPAAAELPDMAREHLSLVVSVMEFASVAEVQVVEATITAILLICDIVDDSVLVTEHARTLAIAEQKAALWFEVVIDERVKSLCAGLVVRLGELWTKMQRTLLDQTGMFG